MTFSYHQGETLDPQQVWVQMIDTPSTGSFNPEIDEFAISKMMHIISDTYQNMCQKVDTFPISYCTFIYFFDNIYIITQFTI